MLGKHRKLKLKLCWLGPELTSVAVRVSDSPLCLWKELPLQPPLGARLAEHCKGMLFPSSLEHVCSLSFKSWALVFEGQRQLDGAGRRWLSQVT